MFIVVGYVVVEYSCRVQEVCSWESCVVKILYVSEILAGVTEK